MMLFEVLEWNGKDDWFDLGLLVGGHDAEDAWATLKVLGVDREGCAEHVLRCVGGLT